MLRGDRSNVIPVGHRLIHVMLKGVVRSPVLNTCSRPFRIEGSCFVPEIADHHHRLWSRDFHMRCRGSCIDHVPFDWSILATYTKSLHTFLSSFPKTPNLASNTKVRLCHLNRVSLKFPSSDHLSHVLKFGKMNAPQSLVCDFGAFLMLDIVQTKLLTYA